MATSHFTGALAPDANPFLVLVPSDAAFDVRVIQSAQKLYPPDSLEYPCPANGTEYPGAHQMGAWADSRNFPEHPDRKEYTVLQQARRISIPAPTHTFAENTAHLPKFAPADESVPTLSIAHVTFAEACEQWLEWREGYRRKGTVVGYRAHMTALKVFFEDLRLNQIQPGHLRLYQEHRAANTGSRWKSAAGASYINHELNTLKQMMDIAGEWGRIQRFYNPLPLPTKQPQRVMTEDEEEQLFSAAKSDSGCFLAYIVALISNNTTASGAELRSIQLRHVLIDGPEPEIEIPHEMVKNSYRARRIPLNESALYAVQQAVLRAHHLGSRLPTDYLFPLRVKRGLYDPTRPASPSWLRKQWEELRRLSGLPWVRPHDMRHQAITRMLERGVNEDAVRSVAGHVSQDILRRYSHQRYAAKRSAVSFLERSIPQHIATARSSDPHRSTDSKTISRRGV